MTLQFPHSLLILCGEGITNQTAQRQEPLTLHHVTKDHGN